MKKALLIMAVALLAVGCGNDGIDGTNGRDGSLNMRVINYEISQNHWIFNPGDGADGLNRHYYYTIDQRMDRDIAQYLNKNTFKDMVLVLEREVEPWVMVPLPSTTVLEDYNGTKIENHTEELTYEYSADPPQIKIIFVDSRYSDPNWKFPPVSMRFRAVYMLP